MKKLLLLTMSCIFCSSLFAQVYKLETIFSNTLNENYYLSHQKTLEKADNEKEVFLLWGYQKHFDDWISGLYEVQYFRGGAKETYLFLNQLLDFTNKYQEEDRVQTEISGVQIRTLKVSGSRFTQVFDKERKVMCRFTSKKLIDALEKFKSYCKKNQIVFE